MLVASAAMATVPVACGLFFPTLASEGPGDGSGADATAGDANAGDAKLGNDAEAIDAPPGGFVLTISPGHLTMDPPNDSFPVTATITRGAGYTGLVKVGVNGLPAGLTATSLTVLAGQTTGTFSVSISAAPPQPDFTAQVFGASSDGNTTSSASLGIHVGSLLTVATADVPTLVVPPFASSLIVKVWGAGGGGEEGTDAVGDILPGGTGGGGGFAGATIPVTPGDQLTLLVGGGGPVPGGGGGYSGIFRGTTPLVVAGGGGGGSYYYEDRVTAGCTQGGCGGNAGGAGGGTTGKPGASGGCGSIPAGGPGTQTAGGAGGPDASAGGSLQGGNGGVVAATQGGKHGGGGGGAGPVCGGSNGGGGGGGYFGGGGGGYGTHGTGGGGGGGSGYAEPGASAQLITGMGPLVANAADPDYADAGAGGAPGTYVNCNPNCVYSNAAAGGGGRIVIRLPKP